MAVLSAHISWQDHPINISEVKRPTHQCNSAVLLQGIATRCKQDPEPACEGKVMPGNLILLHLVEASGKTQGNSESHPLCGSCLKFCMDLKCNRRACIRPNCVLKADLAALLMPEILWSRIITFGSCTSSPARFPQMYKTKGT